MRRNYGISWFCTIYFLSHIKRELGIMDKDLFIENIIHFSTLKREYPTKACEAAGVGKSFVSDIRRGQVPSVEKVQMLADYLGVTTSQLLGEETKKEPDGENAAP